MTLEGRGYHNLVAVCSARKVFSSWLVSRVGTKVHRYIRRLIGASHFPKQFHALDTVLNRTS